MGPFARGDLNTCMRMLTDVPDPSDLIFVLINTAGGVHAAVRDDVVRNHGAFLFTEEEYLVSEIVLGDHLWVGFTEKDIVFIVLRYGHRIMARISARELDEARDVIIGTTGQANYPGLLTALCMSPYGPEQWRDVLRRWDALIPEPKYLSVTFEDPSGSGPVQLYSTGRIYSGWMYSLYKYTVDGCPVLYKYTVRPVEW
jgi:hypothetical protein